MVRKNYHPFSLASPGAVCTLSEVSSSFLLQSKSPPFSVLPVAKQQLFSPLASRVFA